MVCENSYSAASPADLAALDRRWLVGLEVSGWLLLVRACLALAKSVANHLCIKHRSIMLLGMVDLLPHHNSSLEGATELKFVPFCSS